MLRIVSRHLSAAASDSPPNRTLTKLALALVLTTSAAAVVARAALSSGEGLVAQYFRNVDWSGEPALTAVDTLLSTDQLAQDWPDAPPMFSVRWRGYLTVWRAGVYRFRLITDDAARLYLDDQLITVNEDVPNQVGQLHLSSGSHRVRITAAHFQGKPALTWLWSLDGSGEARSDRILEMAPGSHGDAARIDRRDRRGVERSADASAAGGCECERGRFESRVH